MKFIIIFLLFFNVLMASDHDRHHGKDLTFLELDSMQEDKVKDILRTYRKDIKKYRHYKEEMFEGKQDIFENDIFDGVALETINQQVSNFATRIETKFLSEVHQVLSKKQRKKFVSYIDDWEIE